MSNDDFCRKKLSPTARLSPPGTGGAKSAKFFSLPGTGVAKSAKFLALPGTVFPESANLAIVSRHRVPKIRQIWRYFGPHHGRPAAVSVVAERRGGGRSHYDITISPPKTGIVRTVRLTCLHYATKNSNDTAGSIESTGGMYPTRQGAADSRVRHTSAF